MQQCTLMNNQTKKIISFIIIIATLPLLYGIGEMFYGFFPDETMTSTGIEMILEKILTGLLICIGLYSGYMFMNLISEHYIIPMLNKIFRDE